MDNINKLKEIIKSPQSSISTKMKCLFILRNLENADASLCIQDCLSHDSVLLDHEIAYVLGQMKQSNSIEFLFKVSNDTSINPIVRHEAIEALGNFEDSSLIERLRKFINDENPIIKESAILAINKLSTNSEGVSLYGTRDPAVVFKGDFNKAIEMIENGNLIEKYQAIFYFRDRNDKESVNILLKKFKDDSDLLRHEIAFVLGQMENENAIDGLIKVLEDPNEKDIVRHEAAEALGNIGTERCKEILNLYLKSDIKILRESAEVGLGINDIF